jgi:hypothetical protein
MRHHDWTLSKCFGSPYVDQPIISVSIELNLYTQPVSSLVHVREKSMPENVVKSHAQHDRYAHLHGSIRNIYPYS